MFTNTLKNLALPLLAFAYLANASEKNETAEIEDTNQEGNDDDDYTYEFYINAGIFIDDAAKQEYFDSIIPHIYKPQNLEELDKVIQENAQFAVISILGDDQVENERISMVFERAKEIVDEELRAEKAFARLLNWVELDVTVDEEIT